MWSREVGVSQSKTEAVEEVEARSWNRAVSRYRARDDRRKKDLDVCVVWGGSQPTVRLHAHRLRTERRRKLLSACPFSFRLVTVSLSISPPYILYIICRSKWVDAIHSFCLSRFATTTKKLVKINFCIVLRLETLSVVWQIFTVKFGFQEFPSVHICIWWWGFSSGAVGCTKLILHFH